jgi:hypothetical protein
LKYNHLRRNKMVNINKNQQDQNQHDPHKRGFGAMPHDKVEEIASKGGKASAAAAGHEGMAERGRKGGEASAAAAGHEGMAERGRKGGEARGSSRHNEEE